MDESSALPRPRWLATALSIQLGLVFFAPLIPIGMRHLVLSDVWCLGWVLVLSCDARVWQRHWRYALVVGLALAAFYAHGAFRPSLRAALKANALTILPEDDGDFFHAGREAVNAARFMLWLWALRLASQWSPRAAVEKTMAVVVGLAGAATALDLAWRPARELLGRVYEFNPDYEFWVNRAYGPFQSPLEAAVALGLGLILTVYSQTLARPLRIAVAALALAGLLCTRTSTAVVALAGAFVLVYGGATIRRLPHRKPVLGALAALTLAFLAAVAVDRRLYEATHAIDLVDRLNAWSLYASFALSRLDLVVLGFGFMPYPTDSAYVFLFTRGGLVALALAGWALTKTLRRKTGRLSRRSLVALAFIALASLTLDAGIYRHVVYLMMAVGVGREDGRGARIRT